MTLEEFKRYISTGTFLLIGLIVIIFIGYLLSITWPLVFNVVLIIALFVVVALAFGIIWDIFRGS